MRGWHGSTLLYGNNNLQLFTSNNAYDVIKHYQCRKKHAATLVRGSLVRVRLVIHSTESCQKIACVAILIIIREEVFTLSFFKCSF